MKSLGSDLSTIIDVVEAVVAFESKPRIDFPVPSGVTFFSEADVWLFDASLDSKVCPLCRMYDEVGQWRGNSLRKEFPYLEIIDELTIQANVHPNCRCFLKRLEYRTDVQYK